MKRSTDESIDTLREALNLDGHVVLHGQLSRPLCLALSECASPDSFNAAGPLPVPLQHVHAALRATLAELAACWQAQLGVDLSEPVVAPRVGADDGALICLEAGEFRPLAYSLGHVLHFPLQASVLLSRCGTDFDGGRLVLVEQRPRMQSKPTVVHLEAGDAVIFPARHRPVQGARGMYRLTTRHAVTRILAGRRVSAELLFEP